MDHVISESYNKYKILGECLLISSLPGKALRTLVDIIQHAFSKPSLVNFISKDRNLVLYLSAYQVDLLFK